ncbi:MAG: anaerobic ribonucleoside-triphosphate reductase [Butyricicoccaceae bacterium]
MLQHGTLTLGLHRPGGVPQVRRTGAASRRERRAQNLGLEIVGHMRHRMDEASRKHRVNYRRSRRPQRACPAASSGIDRARYGVIPGVTDRDYYTNPRSTYRFTSRFRLLATRLPAKHRTNELDQRRPHQRLYRAGRRPDAEPEAFEAVVRAMKEAGDRLRRDQPSDRPRPGLRLYRHRRRGMTALRTPRGRGACRCPSCRSSASTRTTTARRSAITATRTRKLTVSQIL